MTTEIFQASPAEILTRHIPGTSYHALSPEYFGYNARTYLEVFCLPLQLTATDIHENPVFKCPKIRRG